jgi:hypothetical protein
MSEDSLIDDHISTNNLLPSLIRNVAIVFEHALYLPTCSAHAASHSTYLFYFSSMVSKGISREPRVEMLLERLLAAKRLIALLTFEHKIELWGGA